jgi:hypothetical protein
LAIALPIPPAAPVITAVFLSFAIAAPPKVKTFAQLSPTASKNASDRKRQKSHPRVDLAGQVIRGRRPFLNFVRNPLVKAPRGFVHHRGEMAAVEEFALAILLHAFDEDILAENGLPRRGFSSHSESSSGVFAVSTA